VRRRVVVGITLVLDSPDDRLLTATLRLALIKLAHDTLLLRPSGTARLPSTGEVSVDASVVWTDCGEVDVGG
jgi:hypothetical protein